MSTPMPPNAATAGPDDFREQLSAWRDGALPDEASRFVLKRLLQDDALRAEVGRWQVIGDALRGHAQQRPATDVAAPLAEAIEHESIGHRLVTDQTASLAPSRRAPALRWMATAAAVGMAAVLMWPAAPEPNAAPERGQIASAPGPAARDLPVSGPEPRVIVAASAASRDVRAAPMVASSRNLPVPLRIGTSTGADALAARVPRLVRAPQPTPEQLAPLPAVDAPSRPWPRRGVADGVYTVDYAAPAAVPPGQ